MAWSCAGWWLHRLAPSSTAGRTQAWHGLHPRPCGMACTRKTEGGLHKHGIWHGLRPRPAGFQALGPAPREASHPTARGGAAHPGHSRIRPSAARRRAGHRPGGRPSKPGVARTARAGRGGVPAGAGGPQLGTAVTSVTVTGRLLPLTAVPLLRLKPPGEACARDAGPGLRGKRLEYPGCVRVGCRRIRAIAYRLESGREGGGGNERESERLRHLGPEGHQQSRPREASLIRKAG